MLNTIKDLINQKQAYLEAAQLMLEDTELDDSIVLDESPMEIPPEEKTEEAENEAPEEVSSDETVVEEEQPLPMEDDELPTTPAAEPTGEPVSDDSADIMTAEIDLATNTQTDILPVPPANANDAIDGEGDILSQTVDSGFGDDEDKPAITNTADIMDDPIDEPEVKASDDKNKDDLDINTPVGESDDLLNEAVDDIMDESVDDDNMEKSIEEKEKDNHTKNQMTILMISWMSLSMRRLMTIRSNDLSKRRKRNIISPIKSLYSVTKTTGSTSHSSMTATMVRSSQSLQMQIQTQKNLTRNLTS